jgi:hypothetical protein
MELMGKGKRDEPKSTQTISNKSNNMPTSAPSCMPTRPYACRWAVGSAYGLALVLPMAHAHARPRYATPNHIFVIGQSTDFAGEMPM